MRAVEIRAPGGPEVLVLGERSVPDAGPGEVLVRVEAAGVNRPDVLQRLGRYSPPRGVSDIPGLEVAGTVVARGAGAPLEIGARVCALVAGGGYAEYVAVPSSQCLPVPSGLRATEAAALPETFFTVWDNVFTRGRLKRGDTLLVHGGSSGIGTTAIQLGAAFGARVLATAGSREKCAACVALGAERGILYPEEDFVAVSRDATGGNGVDLILDMVGAPYLARNLEALAVEGRLVEIAFLKGDTSTLSLRPLLEKRLSIMGSLLRPRSPDEKGAIARALLEQVWPLIEAGAVRPIIHATFPLERAAEAHALMESGAHIGKIVLLVGPASQAG
jgi:putative PIG3 family NAD(P)H quinone oxidoreductase